MDSILTVMIVAMFIAIALNMLLKKFQIPTIIGYIFTGTLIINIFTFVRYNPNLAHIAEFGIVFLMFTIGLEFSIKHLMSMKKAVFVNGFLQFMITGGIFVFISQYFLGFEQKTSIIIGLALALSSTAIVLKTLNDTGEINTGYGKKSLGILLFQDIAVIPILIMLTIFTNKDAAVGELLTQTFFNALIVLSIIFIIGKYFINKILSWVNDYNSNEIFISTILLIVISSSYFAHIFGFSFSLGAFIAGMMIAETKFKYQIEADLIPFRDLLLGFFFITVGMQIDLAVVSDNIGIIFIILAVILFVKALVIFGVLALFIPKRTAFKSALTLFQVGEFALAIFEIAKAENLIDNSTSQILITAIVLSMIITPFVLKNLKNLTDKFFNEGGVEFIVESTQIKDHVVVCGYGSLGQKVVSRLKNLGISYVIIEHNLKLVEKGKKNGELIVLGNAAQVSILEAVNIKNSIAAIVAVDNAVKLRLISKIISSINSHINIVVKVVNFDEKEFLDDLKINHIVVAADEIASILVKEAMLCKLKKNI